MRIITILGTRPEIIRLSEIIKNLDRFCDHTVVHTGQNFDACLSDLFFKELGLRSPDKHLGIRARNAGDQIGQILGTSGKIFEKIKPDRVLVLGDTNSGLAAIVAARMGIPVYHMEAGNRCYDKEVPEEINRKIIDHCSDILMPYTQRSMENLVREGIESQRIFVIGNPIYEVLKKHHKSITANMVLDNIGLRKKDYFLTTLHRTENVDNKKRLRLFIRGLDLVAESYGKKMVISLHPRTASKLKAFGIEPTSSLIQIHKPFGFFEFAKLEREALCVLTDSGTVQEECAIFNVPNVILRQVTERAETLEISSAILAGAEPASIMRAVNIALNTSMDWKPPPEYLRENVSATVTKILLSHQTQPHR